MRCFLPIQYGTIWTNKKSLTLSENIVMYLQHIKAIIILILSKIRNNSKFITCAEAVAQIWLFICCKTKLKKKKFFLLKKCFLQNINYLQKKCFYMEKKVLCWNFFLLKKTFFTEKNINENVKKYISHLRKIFLCRK